MELDTKALAAILFVILTSVKAQQEVPVIINNNDKSITYNPIFCQDTEEDECLGAWLVVYT